MVFGTSFGESVLHRDDLCDERSVMLEGAVYSCTIRRMCSISERGIGEYIVVRQLDRCRGRTRRESERHGKGQGGTRNDHAIDSTAPCPMGKTRSSTTEPLDPHRNAPWIEMPLRGHCTSRSWPENVGEPFALPWRPAHSGKHAQTCTNDREMDRCHRRVR
jgi:hypothetical protein